MDNNNYILDILKLINGLQKNATIIDNNNGCTKPILGNINSTFNTRPVTFYLCNNTPLTISYTDGETSLFRVEKIDGSCVTVRLLISDDTGISATNEFATININCIAAIMCSNDISLTL